MLSARSILVSLFAACAIAAPAAAEDKTIKTGTFKVGTGEFDGGLACRNGQPVRGILVALNSMTDGAKLPHSILKVDYPSGAAPTLAVYISDGKREEAVRGWTTASLEREFQKPETTDGQKRTFGVIMGQLGRVAQQLKDACATQSVEKLKAATGRSLAVYANLRGLAPWAQELGRDYRARNRE